MASLSSSSAHPVSVLPSVSGVWSQAPSQERMSDAGCGSPGQTCAVGSSAAWEPRHRPPFSPPSPVVQARTPDGTQGKSCRGGNVRPSGRPRPSTPVPANITAAPNEPDHIEQPNFKLVIPYGPRMMLEVATWPLPPCQGQFSWGEAVLTKEMCQNICRSFGKGPCSLENSFLLPFDAVLSACAAWLVVICNPGTS